MTRLLREAGYGTGHFGKWHLGSGGNVTTNVSAPVPARYGIDAPCTFNSNDPCVADARTWNTSVDIVDRAMSFISAAHAAAEQFYINVGLHVSHDRLDPTEAQKTAALPKACRAAELATNQTVCPQAVFLAAQTDADAQIGRLVGELDLHSSTVILFATDNGPEERQRLAAACDQGWRLEIPG